MKILIVGNGFDLAHYMPTKYDHFMGAMQAVEAWDISKGEMGFDDLFKGFYQKEEWFFGYTKAMYKTDEIKLTVEQIKELQQQLKENVWYQYFSEHVKELKTWIDFEIKIEEALLICCSFFDEYKLLYQKHGEVNDEILPLKHTSAKYIKLSEKNKKILQLISILKIEDRENTRAPSAGLSSSEVRKVKTTIVNSEFLITDNKYENFQYEKFINSSYNQLELFKEILNSYLMEIIEHLKLREKILIPEPLNCLDHIFSFNYTSTIKRFHNSDMEIEFLHGQCGLKQNIVLGISDLPHGRLKELKAYGFVKYHQKLMKNTNYKFILENEAISVHLKLNGKILEPEGLNLTFWGHSLDVSDRNYIEEVFSLNDEKDLGARVLIYFYDLQAKFSLLANLIHILDNHKIETWMKKGWLKFEAMPNIAEINGIKSVTL